MKYHYLLPLLILSLTITNSNHAEASVDEYIEFNTSSIPIFDMDGFVNLKLSENKINLAQKHDIIDNSISVITNATNYLLDGIYSTNFTQTIKFDRSFGVAQSGHSEEYINEVENNLFPFSNGLFRSHLIEISGFNPNIQSNQTVTLNYIRDVWTPSILTNGTLMWSHYYENITYHNWMTYIFDDTNQLEISENTSIVVSSFIRSLNDTAYYIDKEGIVNYDHIKQDGSRSLTEINYVEDQTSSQVTEYDTNGEILNITENDISDSEVIQSILDTGVILINNYKDFRYSYSPMLSFIVEMEDIRSNTLIYQITGYNINREINSTIERSNEVVTNWLSVQNRSFKVALQ